MLDGVTVPMNAERAIKHTSDQVAPVRDGALMGSGIETRQCLCSIALCWVRKEPRRPRVGRESLAATFPRMALCVRS